MWNFLPVNKCLREGWNGCFWKGVQWVSDPGLCSGVWAALEDSCSLFGVWFMQACCRLLFLYCWRRNWPGCLLQSYKSIHAGLAESPVFHLSFWSAAAKLYPLKSHHPNITICFLSYILVLEANVENFTVLYIINQGDPWGLRKNIEFKNSLILSPHAPHNELE